MAEKIHIPPGVAALRDKLIQAGHRACPVGGCVRDSLLGRTPGDWDVCTSARPEELMALFPRAVPTGGAHGTVTVPTDSGAVEVTPFRREGGYSDGRHPDQVAFGASLEEDLARRDFTVNAMALDENGDIVDLFGGRADLERGLIRCVGRPEVRFREDALRMLRGVRFAAQLGFTIEPETLAAMARCAPLVTWVSAERVGAEVEKTLCAPHPDRGALWSSLGLLDSYLDQPGRTPDLSGLKNLPPEPMARWAGLCAALLDGGAVEDAAAFLKGLRRDNRTVRRCAGAAELVRGGVPKDAVGWRRALARYGQEVCQLAALLAGDSLLEQVLAQRPCVRVEDLALSGGDLAELGLSGPDIGRAQRALLERVLDDPEDNTPERLRQYLARTGHI